MGAVFGFKGLRPDRNAKIHVDQAGPRTRQNQEQKAFITAQINIFNVCLRKARQQPVSLIKTSPRADMPARGLSYAHTL